MQIQENVPLAPLTTFRIGGPARWFIRASTTDEIVDALSWAGERSLPVFVLGGGSNLLVADCGFDGLVVHVALAGVHVESADANVVVNVAAGEEWDPFVAHAVENGWGGVECLSGIPGLVGASPIQNIGAYGQEVAETIVRVEALDRQSLTTRWFTADECHFGYRTSRFKNEEPGRWIVLSVTFRLPAGAAPAVRYADLVRELEESAIVQPALSDVRDAVLRVRRRKGMVVDAADPDSRSAGSFFMNPIIDEKDFDAMRGRAIDADIVAAADRIPSYPSGAGRVKLSAAWLIERAGFTRGYGEGTVGLSSKHSLAIVNRGGGSSFEVALLAAEIQNRVRDLFGIEIHPEPNFVGDVGG